MGKKRRNEPQHIGMTDVPMISFGDNLFSMRSLQEPITSVNDYKDMKEDRTYEMNHRLKDTVLKDTGFEIPDDTVNVEPRIR